MPTCARDEWTESRPAHFPGGASHEGGSSLGNMTVGKTRLAVRVDTAHLIPEGPA